MKHNFVKELQWRGMLHDMTPGTEEQLMKESTVGYVGFDPTADSLHIGNLVPVMLLTHFQRCGHKPLVLVGGATGRVGDPSGKTKERQLLSTESIEHNLDCQKKQLMRFLNFTEGDNKAEIVNNFDWFKDINFLDFIRDVGKHMSINYMMAKDSVKNRMETGMSFTEFSYQLIQGYDFFHLLKAKNCKLQMGGSDQWGNITTGTELIRRMGGGEAFALTAPLIKKADGSKFGKSEGGNVWLDREKTSPYQFYQFWINVSDEDVLNFFPIFSLAPEEEINELKNAHLEAPHLRILQKALAEEMTIRVHSAEDLQQAIAASDVLFGKSDKSALFALEERLLMEVFASVPSFDVPVSVFEENIVELLATYTDILPSKSEARKMLKAGAVSINKEKVSEEQDMSSLERLHNKYLIVQRGKKNYFLIRLQA
ncbi:MAG: tyrosine--tRNA ligase [Flavobacteriales bacterium]|nr:MAG: tyrosine--tRNA ligase [Flavobacteriales bacterium]